MKTKFIPSLAAIIALLPSRVLAFDSGLQATGSAAGLANGPAIPLPQLIGQFINAALGLMGIAFFVMAVYAGFLYITSAGDTKEAKKGIDILTTSVIGMIIIFSAYAITNFVIGAIIARSGVSV